MKKFLVFALIFMTAGFVFARGKADDSNEKTVTVTGYINWYGNDPFAFPGFVTEDNRVFSIAVDEGSKFTVQDVAALQGNLIELKGKIDDSQAGGFEVLKDGVFVVKKYKKVEKK